MAKGKRRVPVIPIAFGIAFALIVVIAIVLVSSMNRQAAGPRDSRVAPGASGRDNAEAASDDRGPDSDATVAVVEEGPLAATEQERPSTQTGYTITGQVVDEAGNGVADAEVSVHREHYWWRSYPVVKSVKADSEGNFRAKDLPKELLVLSAAKDGYCFYLFNSPAVHYYPIHYMAGRDHVEGVRLMLRPGAVLAGVVVDEEGEQPVTNAVVTIYGGSAPRGGLEVGVDDEGRFRTRSLVPGWYSLVARAEGFMSLSGWGRQHAEHVTTGREDIVLRLERGCVVEGRVVFAESGAPVPGAEIQAFADRWRPNWGSSSSDSPSQQAEQAEQVGSATADATGHFKITVGRNEETKLWAHAEGYYLEKEVTIRVEGDESPEPITIELIEGSAVSGVVLEEETGEPVEGVALIYHRLIDHRLDSREAVESDTQGRFTLKGFRPGERTIFVYSSRHKKYPQSYFRVNVVQGEDTTGVEVRVRRMTEIAGTVVTAEGEPVFGATITTRVERLFDLEKEKRGTVMSDADGRFVVMDWSRDTIVELEVAHPEYASRTISIEEIDVTGWKGEVRIVLERREGGVVEEAVADAENEAEPDVDTGTIAGIVTDHLGRPVAGLTLRTPRSYSFIRTRSDGTYRFDGLVEGKEYQIKVDPIVGGRLRYKQIEPRAVTASADNVNFVVEPVEYGTLSGVVYRQADGQPVTKFYLSAEGAEDSQGNNEIVPGKGRTYESEDGSFRLEDLLAGQYVVKILAPNLADFHSEPVEVRANEETVQDFFIGEGGAIRGRIVDETGRGVPGVHPEVWTHPASFRRHMNRKEPEAGWYTETETDELGEFTLLYLPPGEAKLWLKHPDYAGERLIKVEVPDGEAADVGEIVFARGALVHGWVKDPNGRLRSGVEIQMRAGNKGRVAEAGIRSGGFGPGPVTVSWQWSARTTTDEQGRFSFARVPSGSYTLYLGWLETTVPVEIHDEEDKEVNLDFSQLGTISGKIVLPYSMDKASVHVVLHVYCLAGNEPVGWRKKLAESRGGEPFEAGGLLPGKYKLDLDVYRKNDQGRYVSVNATTDPPEIIVEVAPKGNVTQDITITKIEERKHK